MVIARTPPPSGLDNAVRRAPMSVAAMSSGMVAWARLVTASQSRSNVSESSNNTRKCTLHPLGPGDTPQSAPFKLFKKILRSTTIGDSGTKSKISILRCTISVNVPHFQETRAAPVNHWRTRETSPIWIFRHAASALRSMESSAERETWRSLNDNCASCTIQRSNLLTIPPWGLCDLGTVGEATLVTNRTSIGLSNGCSGDANLELWKTH